MAMPKRVVRVEAFRDLTVIHLNGHSIVVAADAAGGIGPNELDVEEATGESVAYFATRVVLAELYSVGACPLALINTVPTGKAFAEDEALRGINRLLNEERLAEQVEVGGSSENNFGMLQTAIGVVLIGIAPTANIEAGRIHAGDEVYQLGVCKVGSDVRFCDPTRVGLGTIRSLAVLPWVHEVIPLGSGGVLGEVRALQARDVILAFEAKTDFAELEESAGPATSALVITAQGSAQKT